MVEKHIEKAPDIRQTKYWGIYLKSIGWKTERINTVFLFIKEFVWFNSSFIKIQHPIGPIPFKVLDTIAKKYKAHVIVIEPHNYKFNEKSYRENGYVLSNMRYAHSSTIKIDLKKSEEQIFKSFSENARRNIKKANKNFLKIKAIHLNKSFNKTVFNTFYKLLQNVSHMKKFYIPSETEFYNKMKAFKNNSFLLYAYHQNKPVAVVWFVYNNNVLYYFQTGITEIGYKVLANYLLVWEGIKIGKQYNCEVLDFESIFDPRYKNDNKKYKRYTEFKKRFHGEIVQYPPSFIKIYNPIIKLIYSCFQK